MMSERSKQQGGEKTVSGDEGRHPPSRLVERVTRVLQLDILLRERPQALSAGRLCAELGVSRRTLRRDLTVLRRAGESVGYKRAEGGYRISVPTAQAAAVLSARELGALLAIARGAVPNSGSEFELGLRAASEKLRSALESEFAETLPEIEKWRRAFTQDAGDER
ncbi:MAG: HTH domain-containing protein [Planctomycetota bacterium]|nr:HTH domain-containing protein [Planctomycetota bacterium]